MDKLKSFLIKLNETGIPLPLLYDNVKDRGSYTLTMFFISFNVALITLIGKLTKFLGDVDYSNVLWLFSISGGFYLAEVFGKKFTQDGKKTSIDSGIEPPV